MRFNQALARKDVNLFLERGADAPEQPQRESKRLWRSCNAGSSLTFLQMLGAGPYLLRAPRRVSC